MAIQIKQYILVLLLSFSFSFCAFSQETESRMSLSEILPILEQRYKVQFNYAEDAVSGILVKPPQETLSLQEALNYLEIQTDFSYQLTDDNMVLVIMNEAAFDLQKLSEVVVSGYIVKGINKLSNGSFEIKVSEFDILPGLVETDVLQAVQAFPGIQSINETVSNINIRGGSHDQNLILWDDIKCINLVIFLV